MFDCFMFFRLAESVVFSEECYDLEVMAGSLSGVMRNLFPSKISSAVRDSLKP